MTSPGDLGRPAAVGGCGTWSPRLAWREVRRTRRAPRALSSACGRLVVAVVRVAAAGRPSGGRRLAASVPRLVVVATMPRLKLVVMCHHTYASSVSLDPLEEAQALEY